MAYLNYTIFIQLKTVNWIDTCTNWKDVHDLILHEQGNMQNVYDPIFIIKQIHNIFLVENFSTKPNGNSKRQEKEKQKVIKNKTKHRMLGHNIFSSD